MWTSLFRWLVREAGTTTMVDGQFVSVNYSVWDSPFVDVSHLGDLGNVCFTADYTVL